MRVRRVTLELLRAGPPHNQLLSPLTQYLGVCGDAGASVVNLPYEHHVFLRRLTELRYEGGTEDDIGRRLAILRDTGEDVAAILGSVCGLAGALAGGRDSALIHLRLVLSASELALLPFELSKIPPGVELPADGWLLLQSMAPVCLTRSIRSVPTHNTVWPRAPRILFVAGDPSNIPFEEHRDALEKALVPWATPGGDISHLLTVVRNATFDQVQMAFSEHPYTHVHVLAHGAKDEDSGSNESFGLALVDEDGFPDVVSGERLATALYSVDRRDGAFGRPAVVTLATCDSANQEDAVAAPAASLAHALHDAGIPLVVASQFPLSKKGSVALTRELYEGLLWGRHPLPLLHRIRGMLHGSFVKHSHDWASLVIYEALPSEDVLDEQLEVLAYEQAAAALKAAQKAFDALVPTGIESPPDPDRLEAAEKRVEMAIERLPKAGLYRIESLGLRGSAAKLMSEGYFRLACVAPRADADGWWRRSIESLEDALEDYRDAVVGFLVPRDETFHRKATLHWLLMQHLTLRAVLGRGVSEERLMAVKLVAEEYLDASSNEERAWAHGSLAEMWLLRLLLSPQSKAKRAEAAEAAVRHAGAILALFPRPGAFPVSSTRQQMARYVAWWGDRRFRAVLRARGIKRGPGWTGEHGLLTTARRMVAILDREVPRP